MLLGSPALILLLGPETRNASSKSSNMYPWILESSWSPYLIDLGIRRTTLFMATWTTLVSCSFVRNIGFHNSRLTPTPLDYTVIHARHEL
jgi:hypothetical protein